MGTPMQRIVYNGAHVEAAQLPAEISQLLVEQGIDQPCYEGDVVLGVRFESITDKGLVALGEERVITLLPIGYIWKDSIVGLKSSTGEVYSYDVLTGDYGIINSSLPLFLNFLHQYAEFTQQFSSKGEPVIMTAEEMKKRLEAFQRGELKPKASKNKQPSPAERQQALKKLRTSFTHEDPISVADEHAWWSVILEQLEDDLL